MIDPNIAVSPAPTFSGLTNSIRAWPLFLGGFADGISAAQYQSVAKVSKATATRHLADLVAKGCLLKLPGGGRNTRYQIPLLPAGDLVN
ncbi:MAG: hypothetical protein Q8K23_17590 [Sulfuritalea sp.]|nr:hypothetical protein [Sulfuritalea sp.]